MSPMFLVMLALAAEPVATPAATAAAKEATPPTATAPAAPLTGRALKEAVYAALPRLAKPTDEQAGPAAKEFLGLYHQLQADRQLAASQREYLTGRVRTRLGQLSDQIAQRVAREKRKAELAKKSSSAGSSSSSASPGDVAAPLAGAAGGQGMADDDYGQDLVELIQRTISPASWDVNGGPGSIYYWRAQRCLVVRATDEVHDQIGGTLDQLHRAGN